MDKKFFESYYRAYNREDLQALSEFYHEDVVFRFGQGEYHGKEAFLNSLRDVFSNLKDRLSPRNIIIQGDQAAIEIHDRLEVKQDNDNFQGQKLTKGDKFELSVCAIYKVEGNLIKEITAYQK